MVNTLVSICFSSTQLGHVIKVNCIKFKNLIQKYTQFFGKGSGTSLYTAFCVWFLERKYFPGCILLTDQIPLSDCFCIFRYWVIYVWLFCLSVYNDICFGINFSLLVKLFFYMTKKFRIKIQILSFKGEIKTFNYF